MSSCSLVRKIDNWNRLYHISRTDRQIVWENQNDTTQKWKSDYDLSYILIVRFCVIKFKNATYEAKNHNMALISISGGYIIRTVLNNKRKNKPVQRSSIVTHWHTNCLLQNLSNELNINTDFKKIKRFSVWLESDWCFTNYDSIPPITRYLYLRLPFVFTEYCWVISFMCDFGWDVGDGGMQCE